jgi:hypothetical protein
LYNPTQGLGKPLLDFNKDIIRREDIIKENLVINSTVILHRSLLELVKGFPESAELRALEDYALWLRVSSITDFSYSNEPLIIYNNDSAASVRSSSISNKYLQRFIVFKDYYTWVRKNNLRLNYRFRALYETVASGIMYILRRSIKKYILFY